MGDQTQDEVRATDRLDLIRRLFAVAISLGVGNTIVNAHWIREGAAPSSSEIEQIAIVSLALFATVLSWDGYLASVRKKPLHDWWRFAIDVFLVFIYMILIITSNKSWFWLPIICLAYTLYVLWDALSVLQFPEIFDSTFKETRRSRPRALLRVYLLAVLNRAGIDRGPLISLMWAGYFFGLLGIIWKIYPSYQVVPAICFGAAGLGGYRQDKRLVRNGARGFTMIERALIILSLSACVFLYAQFTGVPRMI